MWVNKRQSVMKLFNFLTVWTVCKNSWSQRCNRSKHHLFVSKPLWCSCLAKSTFSYTPTQFDFWMHIFYKNTPWNQGNYCINLLSGFVLLGNSLGSSLFVQLSILANTAIIEMHVLSYMSDCNRESNTKLNKKLNLTEKQVTGRSSVQRRLLFLHMRLMNLKWNKRAKCRMKIEAVQDINVITSKEMFPLLLPNPSALFCADTTHCLIIRPHSLFHMIST